MKKVFTLIAALTLMLLSRNGVMAQCSINTNDSVFGYSPPVLPFIEQGESYGQAVQVFVPSTYLVNLGGVSFNIIIDSITIQSITGLPAGINYSPNPSTGTIYGGTGGCIWFSGSTNAAPGNYPLTVTVSLYTDFIDTTSTLNKLGIVYSLNVVAPNIESCDSFSTDYPVLTASPTIYALMNPEAGYLTGSNNVGLSAVAEAINPIAPGSTISSVFFSFGVVDISPSDSALPVNFAILAADPNNFPMPNDTLATGSFPLSAAAKNFVAGTAGLLYVPLSSPITVNDTIVYVALQYPTGSGDTLALFGDALSPAGNSYFYSVPNVGWYTLPTNTGQPGDNVDILMGAVICSDTVIYGPEAAFAATTLRGPLSSVTGCTIDTVAYTDESAGAINAWAWSFPGGTPDTSNVQYPYVIYATAGTFSASLTVTDTNGFTSTATLSNYVTIHSSPTATIDTLAATGVNNADGVATVTPTGGTGTYTFAWSNGETGATDTSLLPDTSYIVTVTDGNGCTTTDTAYITYVTGINSITSMQQIKIYPNPTASTLNVEWSAKAQALVEIMDVSGKLMRSYAVDGTLLNTFDISGLASGSYIVKITDRSTGQHQSVTISKQ
jgi:PKD repeat protein